MVLKDQEIFSVSDYGDSNSLEGEFKGEELWGMIDDLNFYRGFGFITHKYRVGIFAFDQYNWTDLDDGDYSVV